MTAPRDAEKTRRLWGRTLQAATVVVFFLLGYNVMSADEQQVCAQVNNPPVMAEKASIATRQGGFVWIVVYATDEDKDPLKASALTLPQNGTLMRAGNMSFNYVPNPGFVGTDSFTIEVSDGKGGFARQLKEVIVNPAADPVPPPSNDPVLGNNPPTTAHTQIVMMHKWNDPQGVRIIVNAEDPDHDDLHFEAGSPTYGIVIPNAVQKNQWVYRPNPDQVGRDVFPVTITDGRGGIVTQWVEVYVVEGVGSEMLPVQPPQGGSGGSGGSGGTGTGSGSGSGSGGSILEQAAAGIIASPGNAVIIPYVPPPPVVGVPCGCVAGAPGIPCSYLGSTVPIALAIEAAYYAALVASSVAVENYIEMAVDTMVEAIFARLEQMEKDLVDWFETFWYYNQRPAMQEMAEQVNTTQEQQMRDLSDISDADQSNQTMHARHKEEAASAVATAEIANNDTCAVATNAGGLGSANNFSRAMRRAWQRESAGRMLNKVGTPDAKGPLAAAKAHADDFENIFCDPRDNNGKNNCGNSDPALYNADVLVTSRLFGTLTVPMHKDVRHNTAVAHMIDNMMGRARSAPMTRETLRTATGRQAWIDRRAYIARKNAARTVPGLIASWRVPGGASAGGSFTAALREGAGIDISTASDNPSYREIMHAITIDRFNSGIYAMDKVGTPERQQMEKIVLNALYLMQLRDYYELLERTALTLAVQVAVMADQYPMPAPPRASGQ